MSDNLDLEAQWPELFTHLDTKKRRAVVQAFAAAWHEGWKPNREDVENLTDYMRGAIDHPEYKRRTAEAAERHRTAPRIPNASQPYGQKPQIAPTGRPSRTRPTTRH